MLRTFRVKTSINVLAGYNNAGTSGTVGVKVADLLDIDGLPTGLSLHVTSAFSGNGGSGSTWATSDYHGLAESFWEWAWNSPTSAVGAMEIRGCVPNASFTLGLAAHSLTSTRHTDFIVNGVAAPRYTNKNTLPPNAPVSIVTTADTNGIIAITGNRTDSFWYFNGLTATYNDAPIITSIDRLEMNNVSTAATNDPTFVAATVSITSDGVTKTVSATNLGNGGFSFIPPMWVENETALLPGSQSVTVGDGTVTSQPFSATLTDPAIYDSVVLTSISVDSYSTVGSLNPPLEVGSYILFNPTEGTVSNQGEWEDLIWDGEYWVHSNVVGNIYLWDRDPSDKIARLTPLEILSGVYLIDLSTMYRQSTSPTYDGGFYSTPRP